MAKAPPIILVDGKEFYEIGLNIYILEDPTGKLTIDDINSPKWASRFKRNKDKVPNFGFSKSTFWARVKIKNKTSDQRVWVLSQNYNRQNYVTLYKKVNESWESFSTGDLTPFKTREI